MIVLVSQMTSKGQITVPAELRRRWGLKEGDQVSFVVDADEVRLVPRSGSVVARTAGVLRRHSAGEAPTAEELREAAEQTIAEEAIESARPA